MKASSSQKSSRNSSSRYSYYSTEIKRLQSIIDQLRSLAEHAYTSEQTREVSAYALIELTDRVRDLTISLTYTPESGKP